MNKLFVILVILASLNSLQAMDSTSRVLAGGSAVVCALGGTELANSLLKNADMEVSSARQTFNYRFSAQEKKKYLFKNSLSGAVRFSSWISSVLLGRYAYNGTFPAAHPQTYASLLAIAAGGALCQSGFAHEYLNRQGSITACTLIFGGGGLALAGAYGVLKS